MLEVNFPTDERVECVELEPEFFWDECCIHSVREHWEGEPVVWFGFLPHEGEWQSHSHWRASQIQPRRPYV